MAEQEAADTTLWRSASGRLAHRAECRMRGETAVPWLWAEGKVRADVKQAEAHGTDWCSVCDPLGALPVQLAG